MLIEGKTVVITGGAGFIGSHLVENLLKRGNNIRVIDDFSSGTRENLNFPTDHNLTIVDRSILDYQAVEEVMGKADVVFHMATRNVRLSLRSPTIVHEVNTTGTLNVLKAAAKHQAGILLYCSSSEVNGTADVVPMPELYHYKPETIYGASKLTGEYYAEVFNRSGWLKTVIARPHNNYGPREHYKGVTGEVIPRFILWALAGKPLLIYGDGKQTRDFTYVTETVDHLIKLSETEQCYGQVYNVCRGNEVSIREIAELVLKLTKSTSKIEFHEGRPSDVLRLFGDPTKLKKDLGSSPLIDIEEGLAKTVDWFRQNIPLSDELYQQLQPKAWDHIPTEEWLLSHIQ